MKKLNENDIKIAVYIAGAIAVIFLIFKAAGGASNFLTKLLQGLGIQQTPEQAQTEANTTKALADLIKTTKVKPTISSSQAAFKANTIYNALKSSAVGDDQTAAYTELATILNDADMALVVTQFGRRQEYYFGIPANAPQTLSEFVVGNFSNSNVMALNDLYRKSKMRWRF